MPFKIPALGKSSGHLFLRHCLSGRFFALNFSVQQLEAYASSHSGGRQGSGAAWVFGLLRKIRFLKGTDLFFWHKAPA